MGPLLAEDTHPDWYITTAFYAAVHWLRSILSRYGISERGGQQIRYKEFAASVRSLKQMGVNVGGVAAEFEQFITLSYQARYDCYSMDWYRGRRDDARGHLEVIRAFAQDPANYPKTSIP